MRETRRGLAIARLDTYSARVAESPGENLPAILGLRSMADARAILILEHETETTAIPGADMCRLLHGKGARVLDLVRTASGHQAIK
eukprot:6278461-Pyramimonas_sp.AAC.2